MGAPFNVVLGIGAIQDGHPFLGALQIVAGFADAAVIAQVVTPATKGLGAISKMGKAGETVTHFVDAAGKAGIESSRYLNGPYSAWTFGTSQTPKSTAGAFFKSLVRPDRLTHTVEGINGAEMIAPKIRGPWSMYQRASGVRRTPGPDAYNIDTGEFFANQLFDPKVGGLRQMASSELIKGGGSHDIALESIGYLGGIGIPAAGLYGYHVYNQTD